MPFPLLAVAGGAAAGGLAGLLSGKKAKRDPYGSLNPEQRALTQKLGPYFESVLGTSPELYPGEQTTPITEGEQNIVNSSNRLSALSESGLSDLINPDPNVFNNRFNTEVADPTIASFRRNTQPIIEEALPTFSIARGKTVADKLADVEAGLLEKRYTGWNDAQNRRLNAITGGASAMNQYAQTAAIPRVIQQAGLDRLYNDWARGQTQKSNSVNQMLQFLGISTVTETPDTRWERAISGAGLGASLGILGSGNSAANTTQTTRATNISDIPGFSNLYTGYTAPGIQTPSNYTGTVQIPGYRNTTLYGN